jgi:hypothetical protein
LLIAAGDADVEASIRDSRGTTHRIRLRNAPASHLSVRTAGKPTDRKHVKDAPSIGTDGELPAGDEEAVFRHYGLAYQAGAGGERRLARR